MHLGPAAVQLGPSAWAAARRGRMKPPAGGLPSATTARRPWGPSAGWSQAVRDLGPLCPGRAASSRDRLTQKCGERAGPRRVGPAPPRAPLGLPSHRTRWHQPHLGASRAHQGPALPGKPQGKDKRRGLFSFCFFCLKDLPASSLLRLFKVSWPVSSPGDLMRLLSHSSFKSRSHFKALFEKEDADGRKPFGNLSGSAFSLGSQGFHFLNCSALSLRGDKSVIGRGNSSHLHPALQFPVFDPHCRFSSPPPRGHLRGACFSFLPLLPFSNSQCSPPPASPAGWLEASIGL